jgi:uncharacterized membrane protein YfcA
MNDLIAQVGFTIFIVGLAATIILAFASAWKAHRQKIKLSRKRFSKFIYLIGTTSVISGVGFTVSTTIDALPEISIFRIFLTSVFCMGVCPIVMVGVYIFDMKYYGYVDPNNHKK